MKIARLPLWAATAAIVMAGCGGSGAARPGSVSALGSIKFAVTWPARTRLVPDDTQQVNFYLLSQTTAPTQPALFSTTLSRSMLAPNTSIGPTTTSAMIPNVTTGSYFVVAEAFPKANPSATDCTAWVAKQVTVVPGPNSFTITMGSTLTHYMVEFKDSSLINPQTSLSPIYIPAASGGTINVPFTSHLTGSGSGLNANILITPVYQEPGTSKYDPLMISTKSSPTLSATSTAADIKVLPYPANGTNQSFVQIGDYIPLTYGAAEALNLVYADGTSPNSVSVSTTISFQNVKPELAAVSSIPVTADPGNPITSFAVAADGKTFVAADGTGSSLNRAGGNAIVPTAGGETELKLLGFNRAGIVPGGVGFPYLLQQLNATPTPNDFIAYDGVATTPLVDTITSAGTGPDIDSGYLLQLAGGGNGLFLDQVTEPAGVMTFTQVGTSELFQGASAADLGGARLGVDYQASSTSAFVYLPDATSPRMLEVPLAGGNPTRVNFPGAALPPSGIGIKQWNGFALVLDSSGIWIYNIASTTNNATLISSASTTPTFPTTNLAGAPSAISIDPNGNVWVATADAFGNPTLTEYTLS